MNFHVNAPWPWLLQLLCILGGYLQAEVAGLAVNWGMLSTHPLPPKIAVKLLRDNGFDKVKLFEADPAAMRALGHSGIQVMVGIPNDLLARLAGNVRSAEDWVAANVSSYISKDGVDIRYVALGNEPFLKDYKDAFIKTTFPALQNVQAALIKAGLAQKVKVTVPLNADIYESPNGLPSAGDFRSDIHSLMLSIIKFLSQNGAPLTVNIYPFLSLNMDPNFPVDFAFFNGNATPVVDGSVSYTNVFDANFDTLIAALEKNGFPSMPVIVGEVGWPTDGDPNANPKYARRFNQGLLERIKRAKGTPRRSTLPDLYLFSLIDEDAKSVLPGNFERHWGIFNYDGSTKYQLYIGKNRSLSAAKGVNYLAKKWCVMAPEANLMDPNLQQGVGYACSRADCTSLGHGSSCGALDAKSNASYAFNAYYQTMNQRSGACNFNNLAKVTNVDPSTNSCRFEIMIDLSKHERASSPRSAAAPSEKGVHKAFAVALMANLILVASLTALISA